MKEYIYLFFADSEFFRDHFREVAGFCFVALVALLFTIFAVITWFL